MRAHGGKYVLPGALHAEPWQQDPRLQALGLRAILPRSSSGELSASGGAGVLMDWRDYRRWRIQQGVAEGDSEIPTGEGRSLGLLGVGRGLVERW